LTSPVAPPYPAGTCIQDRKASLRFCERDRFTREMVHRNGRDAVTVNVPLWDKRPMQLTRFVRGSGLVLVLGLSVSVVGCGSRSQNSTAEGWQAQKDIRAEIRRKQSERVAPKGGTVRKVTSRPKSGS
jgi:hypothetical protein